MEYTPASVILLATLAAKHRLRERDILAIVRTARAVCPAEVITVAAIETAVARLVAANLEGTSR